MNALLSLLLVSCATGDVDITFGGDGFLYPVTLEIESTDGTKTQATWYGAKDQVVARLAPGTYTIIARNHRFGFPQPVEYGVGNGTITRYMSGVTVDHKRFDVRDGEQLTIRVCEPLCSYNMCRVHLPRTKTYGLIVGARPYWFYFAGKREFPLDAPEAYPNGMLFLADPEWGIAKVAADLAEKTYADLHDQKIPTYDHRGNCHWSYMHAVDPATTDENVVAPPELLRVTKEEFATAFADTFREMLEHNCHRPFDAGTVSQLKRAGYLPASTPEKTLVMTLGEDVEHAKRFLPLWKAQRALEVQDAKK